MLKGFFDRVLNKFSPSIYNQEALLIEALKEFGINSRNLNIEIDHINGINRINSVELNLIYPKYFFEKALGLHSEVKKYDFYFNGNISGSGGREKLLKPFLELNSNIIKSNHGRLSKNKGVFNHDYYSQMSDAVFTLCPHQLDWPGPKSTMWTYRFIEACMAKSVPIVFKETMLGDNFIDGFFYKMDEDVLNGDMEVSAIDVDNNFKLAFEKHTLNDEVVSRIKDSF